MMSLLLDPHYRLSFQPNLPSQQFTCFQFPFLYNECGSPFWKSYRAIIIVSMLIISLSTPCNRYLSVSILLSETRFGSFFDPISSWSPSHPFPFTTAYFASASAWSLFWPFSDCTYPPIAWSEHAILHCQRLSVSITHPSLILSKSPFWSTAHHPIHNAS
jgi:hypothetical protein